MQLQLQEIQALRDAVVQSLRDQVTFLRDRKLTRGCGKTMVLQRRAQMFAERVEQARFRWQHGAVAAKVQRERTHCKVMRDDTEGRHRTETCLAAMGRRTAVNRLLHA